MAAVSAWSKPGAWALDAEAHEESTAAGAGAAEFPSLAATATADFPSLAAAAAAKPSKKKKSQTLTLAQFAAKADDPVDVVLPTGPRQRSAEELDRAGRSGFGFSSYGGDRRRGFGDDAGNPNPRGSSSRVSDDSRRDQAPSRADEAGDWGAGKRSGVVERRRERGTGGLFDSQSRADESDSWISSKAVAPPRDGSRERRSGFDFHREGSGADSESWGRKRESFGGSGGDSDSWGRRREAAVEPDTWKKDEPGSLNSRPRLVLQPRSLPLSNIQEEKVGVVVAKEGKSVNSNPFGAARPREEVLKEKGQDWKEIDEKLEALKVKEASSSSSSPSADKKSSVNGTGRSSEDRTVMAWRKPVGSLLGEYKAKAAQSDN